MADFEKLREIIDKAGYLCQFPGTMARILIENGVTFAKDTNVPSWIPVTECLPDHFGEFIVAVEDVSGQVYSDYADYEPYQKKWTTGLFLGVKDKITHWMPLPEPPKED